MPATCFDCGATGHVVADCPNQAVITGNGKPLWCGICAERTRHINLGNKAARCTVCHPLRQKQLKQHRKCPRCHVTVYEWDNGECGNHAGPETADRRPQRETIQHIVETENAR
jgi:uncharacterized paraquat-inducible protein A